MSIQGITEADIANFLAHNPGFFERNAELLASIQLTSPHGQRAVSLQERQMEMLREKIKGLEGKIIEMIRHGQENVAIADRLHRWTRALMLTASAATKTIAPSEAAKRTAPRRCPLNSIAVRNPTGTYSTPFATQSARPPVPTFSRRICWNVVQASFQGSGVNCRGTRLP